MWFLPYSGRNHTSVSMVAATCNLVICAVILTWLPLHSSEDRPPRQKRRRSWGIAVGKRPGNFDFYHIPHPGNSSPETPGYGRWCLYSLRTFLSEVSNNNISLLVRVHCRLWGGWWVGVDQSVGASRFTRVNINKVIIFVDREDMRGRNFTNYQEDIYNYKGCLKDTYRFSRSRKTISFIVIKRWKVFYLI